MTERANRSAKILYRPVGITGSILGGLLGNMIVRKVWEKAGPRDSPSPPGALDSRHSLGTIVAAAALQGAVFAVVKVLVDRGGAVAFQRWSGDWPGE